MISDTPNPHVNALLEVLTERSVSPTRAEVRRVAVLIYEIGKNDGALDVCERLQQKEAK